MAELGAALPDPRVRPPCRRITHARTRIEASLDHGLSNTIVESVETKIRLLIRIAFEFRSTDALIALAMLSLGGHHALPR